MSKIKSITKKKITTEKLYNLAVKEDESYIAQGVVVHNCRSLLIPITESEEFKPDTKVGGEVKIKKGEPIKIKEQGIVDHIREFGGDGFNEEFGGKK